MGKKEVQETVQDKDVVEGFDSKMTIDESNNEASQKNKQEVEDTEQDEMVDVDVGGKKYAVPKELAENFNSKHEQALSELDILKRELHQLKQQNEQREVPKKEDAKEDAFDFEVELFANPKAAIDRLRKEIKTEITQELEGKYSAAESTKVFWDDFYKENSDLEGFEDVVQMVLNREFKNLSHLSVPDASKKLADMGRKEIGKLVKKFGSKNVQGNSSDQLEGGSVRGKSSDASERGEKAMQDRFSTLSDLIKKRRAARIGAS